MTSTIDHEKLLSMYENIVTSRIIEERIPELVFTRVPTHEGHSSAWGMEGVPAGVVANVKKGDLLTHWSGYGYLLGFGLDLNKIFAEILGKVDGYGHGKAGTGLGSLPHGVLGRLESVGGNIPISVGAGLSIKLKGLDSISICDIGEGHVSQGVFWEALNIAVIWKLPVFVVVQNNMYSMFTPFKEVSWTPSVAERAIGCGIPSLVVDGQDAISVYEAAREAIASVRGGDGPRLLECNTYRFGPHNFSPGSNKERYYSAPYSYGRHRSKEEVETWRARDPVTILKARLHEMGVLDEKMASEIEMKAGNVLRMP